MSDQSPAAYFEPDTQVRMAELVQRRDRLRLIAYRADLDIEEVLAQPHRRGVLQLRQGDGELTVSERDYLADKQETRDNAYAAARRLQSLIDALPAPEEHPE